MPGGGFGQRDSHRAPLLHFLAVVLDGRLDLRLLRGDLVDLAPHFHLPIDLYWHCWNLESQVLDALTEALTASARDALAYG